MKRSPTRRSFVKTYGDMFTWVDANAEDFFQLAKNIRLEPSVLERAVESGRMKFDMRPMSEQKNRDDVMHCAALMHKAGEPPKVDEGLFAA